MKRLRRDFLDLLFGVALLLGLLTFIAAIGLLLISAARDLYAAVVQHDFTGLFSLEMVLVACTLVLVEENILRRVMPPRHVYRISEAEAIEIAKRYCRYANWRWEEPARVDRAWGRLLVTTGRTYLDGTVGTVEIDGRSGEVISGPTRREPPKDWGSPLSGICYSRLRGSLARGLVICIPATIGQSHYLQTRSRW